MKTNQLERLLNYVNDINGTDWTADSIRNYSAPATIGEYYTGELYDHYVIYNILLELLQNLTNSELLSIFREFNSYDGAFDFVDCYENDEYFFELFFANKPMEAVRAVHFGDYRYNDEYVRFDAYGNLKSFDGYELEHDAQDHIEELTSYIIDSRNPSYNSEIDGFIELLEEIEEEESEEE